MSSFLFSKGYQKYNKQDLFNKIDAIEISQSGKVVVTKYFGRVINNTNVSDRYEIFDIRGFMKSKIEYLESNFNITFSNLRIRGGIQELILLSDQVEIAGINYYKAFFILNSSDKSRRLSMNLGLYQADNGTYLVNTIKNFSLITKHLKGITDKAEVATQNLDIETFDEQIDSIRSLVGERVMLSQVRNIIIDKDQKVNHNKFDALKNVLRWNYSKGLTKTQIGVLMTPSEKLNIDSTLDFSFDAFHIFQAYMNVFRNQDSYVVRKETEKILKITQCFIREDKLSQLLDILD
jgi:hypothetical protein